MNIVQLAKRFVREDWGGEEAVIFETGKRLLNLGYSTKVFCTMASAATDIEDVDGLPVRRFPYFYPYIGLTEEAKEQLDRKGGSPFSFALMKSLRNQPELALVHLHTIGLLGGIGRSVCQKRKIPYVVFLHGGIFDVPPE